MALRAFKFYISEPNMFNYMFTLRNILVAPFCCSHQQGLTNEELKVEKLFSKSSMALIEN